MYLYRFFRLSRKQPILSTGKASTKSSCPKALGQLPTASGQPWFIRSTDNSSGNRQFIGMSTILYKWRLEMTVEAYNGGVVQCPISLLVFWIFANLLVIQELWIRKRGLIKRFFGVDPIITQSLESSNSQRDPQELFCRRRVTAIPLRKLPVMCWCSPYHLLFSTIFGTWYKTW